MRHATVITLSAVACAAAVAQQPGTAALGGVVAARCAECHDAEAHKGGLDFAARERGDRLAWLLTLRAVRARVAAGEMPPATAEPLTAGERQQLLEACTATLRAEVPKLPPAPGRVTIRRLSRIEWENSIRDLFGVSVAAAAAFPADDLGYGFDNIGAVLSFSTLHLEKYLAATGEVAAQVFHGEDPAAPAVQRLQAEHMTLVEGPGVAQDGDLAGFYTAAKVVAHVELPRDGEFRLRIAAGADQAGDEPARMVLWLDGRELEVFDVPHRDVRNFELTAPLRGGVRQLGISFPNDYYAPDHPDPERRDRNLRVDWLEVIGPLDARPVPGQQAWLHAADRPDGPPTARLRALAAVLLPTVWRRAVEPGEQERAAAVGEQALAAGLPWHGAAQRLLQAALLSPNFLFRCEPAATAAVPSPVPGPALAVRLSYFLWSSAPDAELLGLGASGQLLEAATLRAQVRRLLADPRADALATNFAVQWLELRALDDRTPDPARFPGFDDGLRASMRRQTELLFLAVLRSGVDVRTLLDADFTHLDARLAAFHGVDGEFGAGFVRVPLPASLRDRGGLLGQASVHAVTSNPTRTSPVKRGKWVLENLLGQAPPPPPPGNDALKNEAAAATPRGLREQLSVHRRDPGCAACHLRMDALGFALEQFDAIGRRRERDEQGPIDVTATLPDGRRLDGLAGLRAALVADPAFVRTLAAKLFVFATGREPSPVDRLRLEDDVDRLRAAGPVAIADLVLLVVESDAFRLLGVR